MNKVEKIVGVVKQFDMLLIEIDKEIHIALVVEAGSEYGAEHPQLGHLVLLAQGYNLVDIHLYQLHTMQI